MRFDWSTSVFLSPMKLENDVSSIVGRLQVVRIYSFMKEIIQCVRAISSFSLLRRKIINFIKEIKHALRVFIAW